MKYFLKNIKQFKQKILQLFFDQRISKQTKKLNSFMQILTDSELFQFVVSAIFFSTILVHKFSWLRKSSIIKCKPRPH